LGIIDLSSTAFAFMGHPVTSWIFTALALVELGTDHLPSLPSRTVPMQFGARILLGGLSGATICAAHGGPIKGLIAGGAGAVIGTPGGRAFRGALASAFGSDTPAALIEDAIAIGGAILIVMALR